MNKCLKSLIAKFFYLEGGYHKDRHLAEVHAQTEKQWISMQERLQLHARKTFFSMRIVKQWSRLPRVVIASSIGAF